MHCFITLNAIINLYFQYFPAISDFKYTMHRRQLLIAFVIALLCHRGNTQNPAVDPPIVDVINNVVKGKVNKQYDIKIQKYARFIPLMKIPSPDPSVNYDDTSTSATTLPTTESDIKTNEIQHHRTTATQSNENQGKWRENKYIIIYSRH